MVRSSTFLLLVALVAPAGRAVANDSAASIAAGGIVLRDEKRISMRTERLTISPRKVIVEYEFVNESPADVTTEVAFPVPEYRYVVDLPEGPLDLGGFRGWVDGAEINVTRQVRALVGGKDHEPLLRQLGIDVVRFGNYDPRGSHIAAEPNQITTLPAEAFDRLASLGIVDSRPERGWPRWTVAITWHWTQTFPAGKTVRVRHEYRPAVGHTSYAYKDLPRFATDFPESCADAALVRAQGRRISIGWPEPADRLGAWFSTEWVNYILGTAKSWKMPIRDFELIIERPEDSLATFCWEGRVEKVSKTRFRASAKDFIPTKDLAVYFLY